jgi:hypothetical protein
MLIWKCTLTGGEEYTTECGRYRIAKQHGAWIACRLPEPGEPPLLWLHLGASTSHHAAMDMCARHCALRLVLLVSQAEEPIDLRYAVPRDGKGDVLPTKP